MLDQLLAPLDYPRQAAYNLVRGGSRFLTGKGTAEDAAAMAPGGMGALLAALAGPGAGVLGAGAAQGLGMAAAPDTFGASSVADLMQYATGEAPEDQSWAGNLLMHTITDPAMLYGIGKTAQGLGSLARGRGPQVSPQGTPAGDLLAEQQAYTQGLRNQAKPLQPFAPAPLPVPVELTPEQIAAEQALGQKWGQGGMPPANQPRFEPDAGLSERELNRRIMQALEEDATASAAAETAAPQQAAIGSTARRPIDESYRLYNMSLPQIEQEMQQLAPIYGDIVTDIGDPLKLPGSALLEKLGLTDELLRMRNVRGARLARDNPALKYKDLYGVTPEQQQVTGNTLYDAALVNDLETYSPGALALKEEQLTPIRNFYADSLANSVDDELLWGDLIEAPLIEQLGNMRSGSMNRGQVSELLNALRGRGIPINEEPLLGQAVEGKAKAIFNEINALLMSKGDPIQFMVNAGIPPEVGAKLLPQFKNALQAVDDVALANPVNTNGMSELQRARANTKMKFDQRSVAAPLAEQLARQIAQYLL